MYNRLMEIKDIKKAHLLGIGGIGISGLARFLHARGIEVTGSDVVDSLVTQGLRKDLGITVYTGHDADQVPEDADVFIYSRVIYPDGQPEYDRAVDGNIMTLSYPEMLGVISRQYKTIAIAGTHGKTTVTAMIATIMHEIMSEKERPEVIVGSLLASSGTNYLPGGTDTEWFVVEACEFERSFLDINPNVVVITNIEAEHLDYYEDLSEVQHAFAELVVKLPKDGIVVCDPEDKNVLPVLEHVEQLVFDYTQELDSRFNLKVFGEYNQKNAAAAVMAVAAADIDPVAARKAIENFAGTWRRFEYKGETKLGARVYDDYAHHPTEVTASLQGAREALEELGRTGKIFAVFQPHTFSRTKELKQEFAGCFEGADEVVLLPIYPSREAFDKTIDSRDLMELSQHENMQHIKTFSGVASHIKDVAGKDDLVVLLGAGDIVNLSKEMVA